MKRLTSFLLAATVIFFVACTEGDDTASPELIDEQGTVAEADLDAEATSEATIEDIDIITEAGMELLASNGRLLRDRMLDCATVEKDTVNKIITIDFGDECVGPHGTVRSGKIFIEYNERKYVPGAYRIVTFEDFFVDSVQVEGTRTVTNTTDASSDTAHLAFESKLEGGKLTFPDGTTITREAEHIRTLYRAEDREDNYATLSGEASGTKRDGSGYEITILEDLVYKRGCRRGRIIIPVAGVKQIVTDEKTIIVDYGDGECDNIVEVTVDGETFTHEIKPRGRKK